MALAIDFITTNEYSNTVIIPINKELEEKMTKKTKSTCCNPVLRTQYRVFYDWYCQGCNAKVTRIARIEEYSSLKQINAKQ